jgi:hypothetical protein
MRTLSSKPFEPLKMRVSPSVTSPTASCMAKMVLSLRCASTWRPMPIILTERNIPTIEGEVGGRGATVRANVDYYKDRIADVLPHLGMRADVEKRSRVGRWRVAGFE